MVVLCVVLFSSEVSASVALPGEMLRMMYAMAIMRSAAFFSHRRHGLVLKLEFNRGAPFDYPRVCLGIVVIVD